jgi:predicted RNA-binding Zn-ribbon protein involved in translation (DUF1610 family)
MAIVVACPTCSSKLQAPDHAAGSLMKCPKCSTAVRMPVASAVTPNVPRVARLAQPEPARPETKACPYCGEQILAVAKKCKHCGETVDMVLRTAEEAARSAKQRAEPMVFMNAGGGGASSSSAAAAASGGGGKRYYVTPPAPFPHGLYIFLTILTGGLALTIWFLHCLVDPRATKTAKIVVGTLFAAYWGGWLLMFGSCCLLGMVGQH